MRAGMLIGSECANETEPYIVSVALDSERVVSVSGPSRMTPFVRARVGWAESLLGCRM